MQKIHTNKSLLRKMIVQPCITPHYIIQVQGLCVIILSSCYEDTCSYDFEHCASLHNLSFDEMMFALVAVERWYYQIRVG